MAGQKGNTNKPIDKEPLTETLCLRFSKEEIKEIKEIAAQLEMPKTRLIRNLTLSSLEDAKLLNKLGILKGAKKLLDFKERFSNYKKYQTISIN